MPFNCCISENIRNFAARMVSLESLKIDLKSLEQGVTPFEFELDDAFFKSLETAGVQRGNLHVSLLVNRTNDYYDLTFHIEGLVMVPCDLCLDDMEQKIDTDNRLAAKFGENYSEDDDLVTVVEDEGILDVAWFIYEFTELNIPIKHVHAPGKCNPAMIKKLEEHSATRSSGEEIENEVDPRWAALSNLKIED